MRSMRPDKDISVSTIRIPTASGSIPALVLSPKAGAQNAAGILWIHGGGYIAGTFVGDGEPFYVETLRYIENLKRAGIPAEVDVYHTDIHAFRYDAARTGNQQDCRGKIQPGICLC